MSESNNKVVAKKELPAIFRSEGDLKMVLATQYQKTLDNYFGDPQKSLKFLSSVVSDVQRTPKLLECTPVSIVNSYIIMAELNLMPSGVSGEAYVLPYKGVAQFQLGYQGLVTLFYRAGVNAIYADIVRENDEIELSNGTIKHKIDPKKSMKERGKEIGAYAVIDYKGTLMGKYMHIDDILAHGKKFSKSFASEYSPWNEKNDPERWMFKKTVLKQLSKLVPKNETINKAIGYDNQDSIIADRLESAQKESGGLKMGNLIKPHENKKNEEIEVQPISSESDEGGGEEQEVRID